MTRINEQITALNVRVIDQNDNNVGMVSIKEALFMADELELDLIEVAPNVCKLGDYGKYRYHQSKQNKRQMSPKLKEIRASTAIDLHDLDTKINQLKKFLSKKHPVKFVISQKGRNDMEKLAVISSTICKAIAPSSMVHEKRVLTMRFE